MPRKSRKPDAVQSETGTPVDQKNVKWGGFIELRLDEDEKAVFERWDTQDAAGHWNMLMDALGNGLKFGLSYNSENDFYLATLTGSGVASVGLLDRYCLTARAETASRAIALLLYKHFVILDGNWGSYSPRLKSADRFG